MTTQQCVISDESQGMSAAMEALILLSIVLMPNAIAVSIIAWCV